MVHFRRHEDININLEEINSNNPLFSQLIGKIIGDEIL